MAVLVYALMRQGNSQNVSGVAVPVMGMRSTVGEQAMCTIQESVGTLNSPFPHTQSTVSRAWEAGTWGMPCTQCKILYVGNHPNPGFGPFAEVCCSITRFFQVLCVRDMNSFSPIFTRWYPFHPLPRSTVAPRVEVKDSHALAWPLELGLRTPMLWRGPSSWGYVSESFPSPRHHRHSPSTDVSHSHPWAPLPIVVRHR